MPRTEALSPIAGRSALLIIILGVIGTGLLPCCPGWLYRQCGGRDVWLVVGLAQKPGSARSFYDIMARTTLIEALIDFIPLKPGKALFCNTVVAVVMATMVRLSSNSKVVGAFDDAPVVVWIDRLATSIMAVPVIG